MMMLIRTMASGMTSPMPTFSAVASVEVLIAVSVGGFRVDVTVITLDVDVMEVVALKIDVGGMLFQTAGFPSEARRLKNPLLGLS
jgi:hypothetical protein